MDNNFLFIHKRVYSSKTRLHFYVIILWFWIILYFSTFVFTLLPPQYGWWNYYAQRITEGAVLYKDLYCFLMPYYIWLQTGLYQILDNNILLYYFIGILCDGVAATFLFKLLCRIISPIWSLLFTATGAILQYSYLMYIPLDYNVFIADTVVISLYSLTIGLFEKKPGLLVISGFLLGFASMMKQTVFSILFVASFVCVIVGKQLPLDNWKKYIFNYIVGIIVAIVPGFVVLVKTDTIGLLHTLIIEAGGSKGSMISVIYRFFSLGFPYWIFLLSLITVFYIVMYLKEVEDIPFILRMKERKILVQLFTYSVILVLFKSVLNLSNLKFIAFWSVLYWLCCICGRTIIERFSAVLFGIIKKIGYLDILLNNKLIFVFFIGTILILLNTYCGFEFRNRIVLSGDFYSIKRNIINYFFWTLFLYDAFLVFQILFKKKNEYLNVESTFSFIYICFTSMLFLSTAWMEELYIMPVFAICLAIILKQIKTEKHDIYFKIISTCLMVFIVIVAITQKQILSYSWWGWNSTGLNNIKKSYVNSEIEGLKGFVFDVDTEFAYETILDAIKIYSSEEDYVFNFPHIPLFNVLSKRQTGMNVVAYYFDVCPDIIAKTGALKLRKNPPQMVIWNEFPSEIWDYHELVFRDKKRSGQRDILDWYNEIVKAKYSKVYHYKTISVWVKNVNNHDNLHFAAVQLYKKNKYYLNASKTENFNLNSIDWSKYNDIIFSKKDYSIEKCLHIIFDREACFNTIKDKDKLELLKI